MMNNTIKEMTETKGTIYFDMDGTLANFYGVENWLDYLENEDTTPYEIAKPLFNFSAKDFETPHPGRIVQTCRTVRGGGKPSETSLSDNHGRAFTRTCAERSPARGGKQNDRKEYAYRRSP